jgi:hypothetical protein
MNASREVEDDAAALRNALVRFLIESSFEGTRQAQVADDLLDVLRGLPRQYAELAGRIERRTEALESRAEGLDKVVSHLALQIDQLVTKAKSAPDSVNKQVNAALQVVVDNARAHEKRAEEHGKLANKALQDALNALESVKSASARAARQAETPSRHALAAPIQASRRRSPGDAILVGCLIGSLVLSCLVNVALIRKLPADSPNESANPLTGAIAPPASGGTSPSPPAAGQSKQPPEQSTQTDSPGASISSHPPAQSPPVSPPRPTWASTWQDALRMKIKSCGTELSDETTVGACLCPGIQPQECSLSTAKKKILALQAVLKTASPNTFKGDTNGKLSKATMTALATFAKTCSEVKVTVSKLQSDWDIAAATRQQFDAHEAREAAQKILTELQSAPKCLDVGSGEAQ